MFRRIMIGAFCLCAVAGAGLAGNNVITEDSLVFNVMPTTPGYFNLGNGQYSFQFHAVLRVKGEYFADQRFFSKNDWGRGHRHRIVFDEKGRASFDPKTTWVSKSDDGALPSLDRLSEQWLDYAARIKQGRTSTPPKDIEDYQRDGMLVRKTKGGCDPLKNSTRISFAKVDAQLNRTDELNYDRSLVILSETPLASPAGKATLDECPDLVNNYGEHVLKANAFDFSLFKVERNFVLAPTGLPLTILLQDPIDDFCAIIRYRNGIGQQRDLTIIYASSQIASGFRRVSESGSVSLTDYKAYLAENLESYGMLGFWARSLGCTVVERQENR